MPKIPEPVAVARLKRAKRAASGPQVRYGLGKGGFDPRSAFPSDRKDRCDCTGFVAWVLQISRHRLGTWWTRLLWWKRSPWLETTNIVRDATSGHPNSVFVRLQGFEKGCIAVYGDKGSREGHAALIERVSPGALWGYDCSPGKPGSDISARDLTWMIGRGAIPVTFRQDLK